LGLLFHIYLIADEFVGLADKRLGKLEAQDGGVEPVEVGASAPCLLNKNIKQFILGTAFITEDKLLFALFENELFAYFVHNHQTLIMFSATYRRDDVSLHLSVLIRPT